MDGDDDEQSDSAVDSRRCTGRDVPRSRNGPGNRRSSTIPGRASTGLRRPTTATTATRTRGSGVDPVGVGSLLSEMLATMGTAGGTITATRSSGFQPLDGCPVFAMSGSSAPATGAALSGASATAACQSVVRPERRQELLLFPRRGLLQPSGTARVLRAAELVPQHWGPSVYAPLSLRRFFWMSDLRI